MSALLAQRQAQIEHPDLLQGERWLAAQQGPAAASGPELAGLAGFDQLGEVATFGVALGVGRSFHSAGAARWGSDVARHRHLGDISRYQAVWAGAVTTGALQRLVSTATQAFVDAPELISDPLALEQLGTIDAVSWAAVTAFEAAIEAAIETGSSSTLSSEAQARVAARVSAIGQATRWLRDDAIAAISSDYLRAYSYVRSSAAAITSTGLQGAGGRYLLSGDQEIFVVGGGGVR